MPIALANFGAVFIMYAILNCLIFVPQRKWPKSKMIYDIKRIRNFCIIAHIDHGKSTLADRLLELTGTLSKKELSRAQVLDTMDLERERGITIKLQPIKMEYDNYALNLIDTPGHVDFAYEVSRSLAACETAILVVDATQGIQAQTLSNAHLAIDQGLTIIPVINKIDLKNADPISVTKELANGLGILPEEVLLVSAKTGEGVKEVLQAVIARGRPPALADEDKGAKALIFDSFFDSYRGVVAYIRVMQGELKMGQHLYLFATKKSFEISEVGILQLKLKKQPILRAGEIGYIITGMKQVSDVQVGDTITTKENKAMYPLKGYKRLKPMVFASFYPAGGGSPEELKEALEKLSLNDASLQFQPEKSSALGIGYRCEFLGLLHMDVVQERLEREFALDLVVTAPSVAYELTYKKGSRGLDSGNGVGKDKEKEKEREVEIITSPAQLPSADKIESLNEPWLRAEIITSTNYIGRIMELIESSRGVYKEINYLDQQRAVIVCELPLISIVMDFYDALKSVSSGYASLSYEPIGYRVGDLVRLDVLVAGDRVDALSQIIIRREALHVGSALVKRLKKIIPRANFQITLQATIGGRIVARENIAALKKNVTAHLYGGDVTRKRKLQAKQKEGKKRMKQMGRVNMPQEAFLAILKRE